MSSRDLFRRTAEIATNSWAVSQVAASALEDGGKVVRVVVSLARPGRYDVKAAGNDIIVTVTARDAAPVVASAADVTSARAEAEVAKRERAGAIKAAAAAELAKRDAEAAATAAKADRAGMSPHAPALVAEGRQKLWRWFLGATLAVVLLETLVAARTRRAVSPVEGVTP